MRSKVNYKPILYTDQELVLRIVSLQKNFFILVFVSLSLLISDLFATDYTEIDTQWEYQQKAKIIQFLINKVGWPKEAVKNNTFNLCVLGDLDDFKAIDAMNGQMINNLKIVVSKSTSIKTLPQHCSIIYVAKSEIETDKIITTFSGKPILLLGDMDKFALNGGGMNFIVTRENVALTINTEALHKANIQFDIKGYKIMVVPQEKDLGK